MTDKPTDEIERRDIAACECVTIGTTCSECMDQNPASDIERRAEDFSLEVFKELCPHTWKMPSGEPFPVDKSITRQAAVKGFIQAHSAAKEEVEPKVRNWKWTPHEITDADIWREVERSNFRHVNDTDPSMEMSIAFTTAIYNKLTALEAENRAYRTIQKEFNYLISQLEACVDKADGCDEGPNAIIALRHRQAWEKRHKDILERLRKGSADE